MIDLPKTIFKLTHSAKTVQLRNVYIQSIITECEKIKESIGEENFNKHWGIGYIDKLKKDLI